MSGLLHRRCSFRDVLVEKISIWSPSVVNSVVCYSVVLVLALQPFLQALVLVIRPLRPETVAEMESYIVSDKVGAMKGVILKEKYIVMVWGYALAACETEAFAGTALHHWFDGDVARYRALCNSLFQITGALFVKFARLIVLNTDEDCQNEVLRKELREVDHPAAN